MREIFNEYEKSMKLKWILNRMGKYGLVLRLAGDRDQ
jgi:hypothetical protein